MLYIKTYKQGKTERGTVGERGRAYLPTQPKVVLCAGCWMPCRLSAQVFALSLINATSELCNELMSEQPKSYCRVVVLVSVGKKNPQIKHLPKGCSHRDITVTMCPWCRFLHSSVVLTPSVILIMVLKQQVFKFVVDEMTPKTVWNQLNTQELLC